MSLLKNFKSWYKGWDGELTVKLIHWMYLWITVRFSRRWLEAVVMRLSFLLQF